MSPARDMTRMLYIRIFISPETAKQAETKNNEDKHIAGQITQYFRVFMY